MRFPLVPLGLACALVLPSACLTHTCTDAGCGIPLAMSITGPNDAALPEVPYAVELDLDGSTYTFSCGELSPGDLGCDPVEGEGPFQVEATYTTNGVIAIFVGDFDGVTPDPSDVAMLVQSEGTTLFDQSWSITYDDIMPNGPDCGPTCRTASEHPKAVIIVGES